MVDRLNAALLSVAFAAAASAAHAQSLPDPMRPPAAFRAPAASTPGAAPVASAQAPVLQLVRLGGSSPPAAVIDGQLVGVGEPFGDARLIRVTERGAVLKGARGEIALALTPAAEKQQASRKTAAVAVMLPQPVRISSTARGEEKKP